MYCEKCNLQLEDDSLFCPYCGNKAAEENKSNICLKCRNKIPEDSEFCPFCGTTISKIDSSETVSSEGVLTNKNAERKK